MWQPLAQGHSMVHGLEPRIRIVVALLFTLTFYAIWDGPMLAMALGIACAAVLGARIPWENVRDRLVALNIFLSLMLATLPWNTPGTALFEIFGYQYSLEGLRHGAALAVKANALMLLVTALVSTIEVTCFGASLERLGMPMKLTRLLLFAARYLEIISREYSALRRTLLVRGFRLRFSRHGLRTLGYLLGMLFVRSFERAERITAAMKCRGFDGHFPGAVATPIRLRDGVFLAASILACVGMMAWQFG